MTRRRADRCLVCRAKLKTYERPEGFCDACLRAHQTRSFQTYDAAASGRKENVR